MSRWDPKPTPYQRRIVRHRRGLLVVSVVYMVVTIGLFVYCLVTSQLTVSVVLNAIVAIGVSINLVYILRNTARFIEKSDSTDDSVPNSGNHVPPREFS
jgi:positive regulator of sigma E activity